jgi:hypothetical protein
MNEHPILSCIARNLCVWYAFAHAPGRKERAFLQSKVLFRLIKIINQQYRLLGVVAPGEQPAMWAVDSGAQPGPSKPAPRKAGGIHALSLLDQQARTPQEQHAGHDAGQHGELHWLLGHVLAHHAGDLIDDLKDGAGANTEKEHGQRR